jgi:hypothetical protein
MERETGIEPATNSLEGCDSTTELLPPTRLALFASSPLRRGKPAAFFAALTALLSPWARQPSRALFRHRGAKRRLPPNQQCHQPSQAAAPTFTRRRKEGWWGGEGSNLRSPKAAGLQPAAIDRSATSPKYINRLARSGHDRSGSQRFYPLRPWAMASRLHMSWSPRVRCIPEGRRDRPMELAEGFEPPTG